MPGTVLLRAVPFPTCLKGQASTRGIAFAVRLMKGQASVHSSRMSTEAGLYMFHFTMPLLVMLLMTRRTTSSMIFWVEA